MAALIQHRTVDTTILDLNNELQKELKRKSTKDELERLDKLKEKIESAKHHNRVAGWQKRRMKKALADEGPNLSKIEYKRRLNEIDKVPHIDLKLLYNKADRILKKDFHFKIRDTINDSIYQIKASTLIKKSNPALFLARRWKHRIEKAIVIASDEDDKRKLNGLNKLLQKAKMAVDFLENGESTYTDDNIEEWNEEFGDEELETYEEVFVLIEDDYIDINQM